MGNKNSKPSSSSKQHSTKKSSRFLRKKFNLRRKSQYKISKINISEININPECGTIQSSRFSDSSDSWTSVHSSDVHLNPNVNSSKNSTISIHSSNVESKLPDLSVKNVSQIEITDSGEKPQKKSSENVNELLCSADNTVVKISQKFVLENLDISDTKIAPKNLISYPVSGSENIPVLCPQSSNNECKNRYYDDYFEESDSEYKSNNKSISNEIITAKQLDSSEPSSDTIIWNSVHSSESDSNLEFNREENRTYQIDSGLTSNTKNILSNRLRNSKDNSATSKNNNFENFHMCISSDGKDVTLANKIVLHTAKDETPAKNIYNNLISDPVLQRKNELIINVDASINKSNGCSSREGENFKQKNSENSDKNYSTSVGFTSTAKQCDSSDPSSDTIIWNSVHSSESDSNVDSRSSKNKSVCMIELTNVEPNAKICESQFKTLTVNTTPLPSCSAENVTVADLDTRNSVKVCPEKNSKDNGPASVREGSDLEADTLTNISNKVSKETHSNNLENRTLLADSEISPIAYGHSSMPTSSSSVSEQAENTFSSSPIVRTQSNTLLNKNTAVTLRKEYENSGRFPGENIPECETKVSSHSVANIKSVVLSSFSETLLPDETPLTGSESYSIQEVSSYPSSPSTSPSIEKFSSAASQRSSPECSMPCKIQQVKTSSEESSISITFKSSESSTEELPVRFLDKLKNTLEYGVQSHVKRLVQIQIPVRIVEESSNSVSAPEMEKENQISDNERKNLIAKPVSRSFEQNAYKSGTISTGKKCFADDSCPLSLVPRSDCDGSAVLNSKESADSSCGSPVRKQLRLDKKGNNCPLSNDPENVISPSPARICKESSESSCGSPVRKQAKFDKEPQKLIKSTGNMLTEINRLDSLKHLLESPVDQLKTRCDSQLANTERKSPAICLPKEQCEGAHGVEISCSIETKISLNGQELCKIKPSNITVSKPRIFFSDLKRPVAKIKQTVSSAVSVVKNVTNYDTTVGSKGFTSKQENVPDNLTNVQEGIKRSASKSMPGNVAGIHEVCISADKRDVFEIPSISMVNIAAHVSSNPGNAITTSEGVASLKTHSEENCPVSTNEQTNYIGELVIQENENLVVFYISTDDSSSSAMDYQPQNCVKRRVKKRETSETLDSSDSTYPADSDTGPSDPISICSDTEVSPLVIPHLPSRFVFLSDAPGAYGTVYKARDLSNNGHIVALKKVRVPLTEDGVPMSTLREIALLKQLDQYEHPHIVRLLDICHGHRLEKEQQLVLFLVFEHVDQDLASYMEHCPPPGLSGHRIKEIMHQILCGVDFLHTHRVIHRDLKPQNLLVTSSGSIKLADFGLAKTYDFEMRLTSVVVTLWYRSPEVLLGLPYATPVDMWSSGCIMAELFTLSPLFCGSSEADQLDRIFRVIGTPAESEWPENVSLGWSSFSQYPPKSLDSLLPEICEQGQDLLQRMLRFDASQRISAADALQHPYFKDSGFEPLQVVTNVTRSSTATTVTTTSATSTSTSDMTGVETTAMEKHK